MANIIEEFVVKLGWDVETEDLEQFDKAVEDMGNTIKWISGLVVGASAALGALVVSTNRETAEMANLAASVGMSAESLEAMTGIVKNVGFEADNVVDLVEEMNNKFGEMAGLGEMTAVKESLKILNLEFSELKKLAPEEQFTKIIDKALELEDAQQAVAAVDMLMGGEANKILGFLRSQDKTLGEMLERYKALNLLSEEGREGAQRFTAVWGQFTGVLQSILKLFSGLVGDAIAPMVDEFLDFVAANRELIQTKVKDWAIGFVNVLKTIWSVVRETVSFLSPLIEKVGGLGNAVKLLGLIFASVKIAKFLAAFKAVAALSKFKGLITAIASPAGILAGLLVVLGLAVEDFMVYMEGGNSLVGKWADSIADFIDNSILPLVEELTGLTEHEFKMALVDTVEDLIQLFTVGIPEALDSAMTAFADFFLNVTDENLSFAERFEVIWEGLKSFLGTWFEALKAFYTALFPDLTAKIGEFAEGIKAGIKKFVDAYQQIVQIAADNIAGFVGKAKSFLSGLPLIGSLFEDSNEPKRGAAMPAVNVPLISPSDQISGSLSPSQSAVNNTSNRSQNVNNIQVENRMNVTQMPGENSEQLARRVSDMLGEQVATAVRNNETGVVY
jgi:hypothetical protein